jgi:hypothetical protein
MRPEEEDEAEEDAIHGSRAEPERPMDDSDLGRIDRQCFDALSVWLSSGEFDLKRME